MWLGCVEGKMESKIRIIKRHYPPPSRYPQQFWQGKRGDLPCVGNFPATRSAILLEKLTGDGA